ncbi:aldo/keto reductase [Actinacidiphila oryziradicis]|uniref:Aldo/keto reductase n=1 Tax=Actinacidiphila oryziradicis TaxID=2571141 RepID=A0A4U0S3M3_9ACTN|nr:aldo/keto reductase [Actinacidiphila oryziradicis]
MALAWLLRNPVVSTAIAGAETTEQLRSNLETLAIRLDDDFAERLARIWLGPGEAPQAYAYRLSVADEALTGCHVSRDRSSATSLWHDGSRRSALRRPTRRR